ANTVSTLVGQLTRSGVVARERDAEDGRVTRLALTPSALEWLKAWRDERAATLLGAVDRLDAADRRALHAALGPLERLTAELHEAGADG
ncbi:MAG TPA: MarR family transcriptional regulator, partial [Amycolatopsis sp.]